MIDPAVQELTLAAFAADFYGMPVMAYLDHLRLIRERYGEAAARFDLEHANALRDAKIEAQKRAAQRTG